MIQLTELNNNGSTLPVIQLSSSDCLSFCMIALVAVKVFSFFRSLSKSVVLNKHYPMNGLTFLKSPRRIPFNGGCGCQWNINNHTNHQVNIDKEGNIFLDGFRIADKIHWNMNLNFIAERKDLICLENDDGPQALSTRTIIVLKKVKKRLLVSVIYNAKVSDSLQSNITAIDAIIQQNKIHNIYTHLILGQQDLGSAFSVFPKEIITFIAKCL